MNLLNPKKFNARGNGVVLTVSSEEGDVAANLE
jgi:hypothetical protein